jgi:hypothetical protein
VPYRDVEFPNAIVEELRYAALLVIALPNSGVGCLVLHFTIRSTSLGQCNMGLNYRVYFLEASNTSSVTVAATVHLQYLYNVAIVFLVFYSVSWF